ncbi:MAG: YhcH/YjgK/YiaL family protein [Nitrospirae bacterium]|nr:YhcH/YjgK/YiaL family protein [Nitrospirota bacterium]
MILDSLDNFNKYLCLHQDFIDAAGFIGRQDLAELPQGKYEIGSRGVFALVSEYETKEIPQCFIECHRRYIDIQFLLTGREKIGVCNKKNCTEEAYDEGRDFQKLHGEIGFVNLTLGLFAIFFPHDGHMPQTQYADKPETVKKIVIKVPV